MTDTFRYSRSILIQAPREQIAPEISDLRRHECWSPFAAPDPRTTSSYEGVPGVGQSRTFAGGRSGAGRISVDAVEAGRIAMTLLMTRPVRTLNAIEFLLQPEGGGTRVSWIMTGPNTLVSRIIGLFIDCEAMCGRMFDQGLVALKTHVEGRPETALAA